MTLAVVLDALADRIADGLGDGTVVGDATPDVVGLPAVTLTIEDATEWLAGVGRIPRGTRTGALPVSIEIDLENPVLDLGGGESLELLSEDRRTLTLPHGPLVRADGVGDPPFGPEDLEADDGAPYEVVQGPPTGRQVQPDPVQGTLLFGDPLPATGTLAVGYHVGQWDVTVVRYQGELGVSAAASTGAATGDLSRRVAGILAAPDPAVRLVPRSWGAIGAEPVGESEASVQRLAYRFDAELELPQLPSGGGVIVRVAVTVGVDGAAEQFDVVREGSPA
jgi:hypothetical protein